MSDKLERGVGLTCIILDWRLAVLNTKYFFAYLPIPIAAGFPMVDGRSTERLILGGGLEVFDPHTRRKPGRLVPTRREEHVDST